MKPMPPPAAATADFELLVSLDGETIAGACRNEKGALVLAMRSGRCFVVEDSLGRRAVSLVELQTPAAAVPPGVPPGGM